MHVILTQLYNECCDPSNIYIYIYILKKGGKQTSGLNCCLQLQALVFFASFQNGMLFYINQFASSEN